jgi:hypothetical protein
MDSADNPTIALLPLDVNAVISGKGNEKTTGRSPWLEVLIQS